MSRAERELRPDRSALERFGYELRQRRKARGLSQDRLGVLTHVSGDLVYRIEVGERRPSRDFAERSDRGLEASGALIDAWEAIGAESQPADDLPAGTDRAAVGIDNPPDPLAAPLPSEMIVVPLLSLNGEVVPTLVDRRAVATGIASLPDSGSVPHTSAESLMRSAAFALAQLSGEDDEDTMRRRAFFLNMAAIAGLSQNEAARSWHLEAVRHELGRSMAEHRTAADVDEWGEISLEYGQAYLTTAPAKLLDTLMVDLLGLHAALRRYADESAERELRRVGSLLSAFMAQTIGNLGNFREARRWWRTARHAADQSGDPYTALWIRGREIVRAGYDHCPATVTLRLIEEAEALAAVQAPPEVMPQLLAGKAQTLALMSGRQAETEDALRRLRKCFSALPPAFTGQGGSLFTWGEERLYFTESFVYSHLGDLASAEAARSAALPLYPSSDVRTPAQLELHRALCLVRGGDVTGGIGHAQAVISGLPGEHRFMLVDLGWDVMNAIPEAERQRPDVDEYRTWLSALSKAPSQELPV